MGKQRDYAGKLYDTFSSQMDGFSKTESEFRKSLESPEYQKKVFNTLSAQMEGFGRTEDEFYSLLKKKENTVTPTASSGTVASMGGSGKYVQAPKKQTTPTQQLIGDLKSGKAKIPVAKQEVPSIKEEKPTFEGTGVEWYDRLNSVSSSLLRGVVFNGASSVMKGIGISAKAIDDKLRDFGLSDVNKPIEEYQTYKTGQEIKETGKEMFPEFKQYYDKTPEKVIESVGEMAAPIIAAIITKNPTLSAESLTVPMLKTAMKNPELRMSAVKLIASNVINKAPSIMASGVSTGVQNYEEAKSKGATEDQASEMFFRTAIGSGVLEQLPLGNLLSRVDKVAGGQIKNSFIKYASSNIAKGTIEEAITGGLDQIWQNKSAQDVYDTSRQILDGVKESATVEGGVGFVLNALGVSLAKLKSRSNSPEINKAVNDVYNEIDNTTKEVVSNNAPLPKDIQAKVDKFNSIINSNAPESVKNIARNELDKITLPHKENAIKDIEKIGNIKNDKIVESSMILDEISELESQLKNPDINTSVDLKDAIEAKINELKTNFDNLNKQSNGNGNETKTEAETQQAETLLSNEVPSEGQLSGGTINENPALKDVESTTKALDEKGKQDKSLIYKLKNIASSILANGLKIRKNSVKNDGERFAKVNHKGEDFTLRMEDVKDGDFNVTYIDLYDNSGKKIGGISLIPNKESNAFKISMVDINESQQGKGLSSLLYKEALSVAKEKGLNNGLLSGSEALLEADKTQSTRKGFVTEKYGDKDAVLLKDFKDKYRSALVDVNISEAYHKAKVDDSNPELVKAVEDLLNNNQNDTQNEQGLPSQIGGGQELIQTQPDQTTSGETTQTGGVLQTPEVVLSKQDKESFDKSLSSKEETLIALDNASKFQKEKVDALSSPVIGKIANVYDSKGKIKNENVIFKGIGDDGKAIIKSEKGKESKVDVNTLKRSINDVVSEYHSDGSLGNEIESIIKDDISSEFVNRQRRMTAPIEEGFSAKSMLSSNPILKKIYDNVFSSGERSAVRALETKSSISSDKKNRLMNISGKLLGAINKNKEMRSDANTVISKSYIDDKIDSFTNKTVHGAMSSITGIDEQLIKEALSNPTLEENVKIIQDVDNLLKSKTENGTNSEVKKLIDDEIKKDSESVRDLSVKWINNNSDRASIENDILKLQNGDKIVEMLKKAELDTIEAADRLSKTKEGREVLAYANQSRDLMEEFSNWVDNSMAALKIKNRDIGSSIINNSAIYLKKTYDFWNDKNLKIDGKLENQAVNSIVQRILPEKLTSLSNSTKFINADESSRKSMVDKLAKETEIKAREIYGKYVSDITAKKEYKPSNIYPNESKVQSKNTWERNFINEEFGKLLGKNEDAIERMNASVFAQAQIQSAAEMAYMIENFSGERFFNSEKEALKSLMDGGMTATEAGVELGKNYKTINDKLSLLDGKVIPAEIYDTVFEKISTHNKFIFDLARIGTSIWRLAKTVYNPAGHFTNAIGGHILIAEQGHGIDTQTANFFLDRFKLMKGESGLSEYAKEIKKLMIDTGLWDTSVNIEDINILLRHSNDIASGDKNLAQKALSGINKVFNESAGGIKRYYSATDSMTKLILFHKKKDIFAEKIYSKPYDSLTTKERAIVDANIAERVKQNTPTSSRLSKLAKGIISSTIIGDFQGFRFGAFSSFINTVTNAISDIHKGHTDKSLSSKQKNAYLLDGYKTLSSSATMAFIDHSMAAVWLGLAGGALGTLSKDIFEDKKDELGTDIGSKFDFYKNIKNSFFMPEWAIGQNLVVSSDDGKGNIALMNMSNTFPNDEIYKILGSQENLPMFGLDNSATSSAFWETFGFNGFLKMFSNMTEKKDEWGNKIDNRALYVAEQFIPPSIKNMHKLAKEYAKDAVGPDPTRFSDKDSREVTALNYLKGMLSNSPQLLKRTYNINLRSAIYNNLQTFYEDNKGKFDNLTPDDKRKRLASLEPVRKSFLELRKYQSHHNNKINAIDIFKNAMKGTRGRVSDEEKRYILYGIKPIIK